MSNNEEIKKKILDESLGRADKAFTASEELCNKLIDEYNKALSSIQKEVAYFHMKYANENRISYAQATEYLKTVELKPFRHNIEELNNLIDKGDIELLAQVKALDAKDKITRLEALMINIRIEVAKLQNTEIEQLNNHLKTVFNDNYFGAAAGIKDIVSIKGSLAAGTFNTNLIEETIKFPWSGQSFSEIIWGNTNKLAKELKSELTQGFIKGDSVQKMSSNLAKRMDSSRENAMRVVRTESAHVLNKAAVLCYEELGSTKVEYCAVLDGRTSTICLALHGDIIDIKDAVTGKNIPPLHPNCRSTVIPVIDDDSDNN